MGIEIVAAAGSVIAAVVSSLITLLARRRSRSVDLRIHRSLHAVRESVEMAASLELDPESREAYLRRLAEVLSETLPREEKGRVVLELPPAQEDGAHTAPDSG